MSYILDALKKLEQDKSKKSRGGGQVTISGSLFENESPKPSASMRWKIVLAVTVAVLVTFTATWQLLSPGRERVHPAPRKATPAPQAHQNPPAAVENAQVAPVAPAISVQPAAPVTPPVQPVKAAPVRPTAKPSKPLTTPVPAAATTEDAAAELTLQELRKRTKTRNAQAVPAEQIMAAPADIKLSGIAWQDERRARRAVVNGFLMQEGGVVSGARITDIFQDSVRFSLSGKVFEMSLVNSGVPTAGK